VVDGDCSRGDIYLSEPESFDDILTALARLEGSINGIGPADG
jgi:hypothetical protein